MSDVYLVYIGKGKGTLVGVPARDLTFSEAEQFGITALIQSGFYQHIKEQDTTTQDLIETLPDLPIQKVPKRKRKESE